MPGGKDGNPSMPDAEVTLNYDNKLNLQLDWLSETDTLKINLPRDREGYDGFEYTDEKCFGKENPTVR